MPKLVPIKPKKLIKILLGLGFIERDAEGSHVFFKHPDGRTTLVPRHGGEDIGRGLLRQILREIEVTPGEFSKHL